MLTRTSIIYDLPPRRKPVKMVVLPDTRRGEIIDGGRSFALPDKTVLRTT